MMTNELRPLEGDWALILGASSGFGEATALELARLGMHIFGVHLDRRGTLPNVERITGQIQAAGREAVFFNANAADAEKRQEILNEVQARLQAAGRPSMVRVLLHSLAFGTLKAFISKAQADAIAKSHLDLTLGAMSNR